MNLIVLTIFFFFYDRNERRIHGKFLPTNRQSGASAVKCEARGARRLIKTRTNGIAIIQRVLDSLSAIQGSLSDACVPHKFFFPCIKTTLWRISRFLYLDEPYSLLSFIIPFRSFANLYQRVRFT